MAAQIEAGKVLLDSEALNRTIARIAHEIVEGNRDLERTALIGIHTRGVPLAQRLRRLIADFGGAEIALGTVDITFHRDIRTGTTNGSGAALATGASEGARGSASRYGERPRAQHPAASVVRPGFARPASAVG